MGRIGIEIRIWIEMDTGIVILIGIGDWYRMGMRTGTCVGMGIGIGIGVGI